MEGPEGPSNDRTFTLSWFNGSPTPDIKVCKTNQTQSATQRKAAIARSRTVTTRSQLPTLNHSAPFPASAAGSGLRRQQCSLNWQWWHL